MGLIKVSSLLGLEYVKIKKWIMDTRSGDEHRDHCLLDSKTS
jgi:hypothetical protein